ncbi:ABC transporter ATP-binding protein [Anaerotardibacter muris]|uniref:ABC transporter ATP-binding protein n=1 Tax=Anaerotardibacter muris TaxID=2941505 RepID=UPI00203C1656|nr:ABC transporter ATP-binding protein [Anaerotardibacter muris]
MPQPSTNLQDLTTIKRTLYFFWKVTKMRPWPFILGIIATIGFVGLLTYANTYVMSLIVDRLQIGSVAADQVWDVFGPYIIALIIVNIVGQLCSKLQDYAIFKTEINGNYNLARLCFNTLSNQSMTFHTNRFGGSLVSQTSKFMTSYSLLVETTLLSLLPTVIAIVCTISILAPIVPSYVAVLTVMLVLYIAVAYIMFRKITPLSAAAASAQNKVSGVLSDAVTNILAVKTYGREDYESQLFTDATLESVRADSRNMRATLKRGIMTSSLIVIIMSIVSVFTAGGNAWFGISAGTLVMMFTYTYNLTQRFNMINSMLSRLNKVFGDASEMTRILDEPRLVADVDNAQPLKVTEGNIDFEHIGFTYEDSANTTPVFTDLNLHIPGGQRVGLVGLSGSGKTTLTKLLLRLSDVQQGEVLVDGQDISKHSQQSLRRQIAYVPQEALLFHRSIFENIAYGKPDASREEVIEAAKRANAYDFIQALPNGFDTMVGERGIKLSGGQRQRIAIARAILADAPILVLDEATSALDSESEAAVQEALANLMQGRTAIVVAHRLSTVASLDRIVVLDDGQIVEDGTHEALIDAGGEYANLWNRQTGAFLDS